MRFAKIPQPKPLPCRLFDIIKILCSCDIPTKIIYRMIIGDIMLPHPVGIVISKKAIIGNKCVIYQGVTIGTIKFSTEKEYPKIRNEVIIYANSIIVGNIEIGNHAIIGANKIINYDVKIGEIITK